MSPPTGVTSDALAYAMEKLNKRMTNLDQAAASMDNVVVIDDEDRSEWAEPEDTKVHR
jgi:hypothetical protein